MGQLILKYKSGRENSTESKPATETAADAEGLRTIIRKVPASEVRRHELPRKN